MFPFSRNFLKFAAAGVFILATATAPANAVDKTIRLMGPVGPYATIMTTFGSKGVIAFYEPNGTHCDLFAVVYNVADESGASASQIRESMNALQVVTFDSPENKSLALTCGENAETLTAVDNLAAIDTDEQLADK
jgi:hypothetical protein